jgi:hypothetical protein
MRLRQLIKYLKVTTDDIIPELVWNYKPQGQLLLDRRSKVNLSRYAIQEPRGKDINIAPTHY